MIGSLPSEHQKALNTGFSKLCCERVCPGPDSGLLGREQGK